MRHPLFARAYALLSPRSEQRGSADHRDELLRGLSGCVVEIGCGNGLNFTHYPAAVHHVLAVEPEDYLRRVATAAAERSGRSIAVVEGEAEDIPAQSASFDAAVTSLVLCSVPHLDTSLGEIRRVLRPDGELRFYEHVRAQTPGRARLQSLLSPAWQAVGGGCHPDRDVISALTDAGFEITELSRFEFCPGPRVPLGLVSPHVLGRAVAWHAEPT
jgi:ubiquinone/menaquinone biosynthesis C-methylase UbiE